MGSPFRSEVDTGHAGQRFPEPTKGFRGVRDFQEKMEVPFRLCGRRVCRRVHNMPHDNVHTPGGSDEYLPRSQRSIILERCS